MEIETKLDVHPSFVVPDLAGAITDADVVDQGEATLRATYWDTEDLRLARAGVTVRHRRSAGSGSWQVKLGLGDGPQADALARVELDFPGGPTRPPREVRDQVAVAARGGDLLPVARLTTRRRTLLVRRDDEQIAEVVDDEVSILHEGRIASRFRELEVELGPAGTARDRRSLVATLTAEGARRSEQIPKVMRALGPRADEPDDLERIADPVVAEIIGARLRRLRSVDPAARRDESGAAGRLADLLEELAAAVDLLVAGETGEEVGFDGSAVSPPEARTWRRVAAAAREVAVVDEARRALVEALADVRSGTGAQVPLPEGAQRDLERAVDERRDAARAVLGERLADPAYVQAAAGTTQAAVAGALRATASAVVAVAGAWDSVDDAAVVPRFVVAVEAAGEGGNRDLGRLPERAQQLAAAVREHDAARRALDVVGAVATDLGGPAAFTAGLAAGVLSERADRLGAHVVAARDRIEGKRLRRLLGESADEQPAGG